MRFGGIRRDKDQRKLLACINGPSIADVEISYQLVPVGVIRGPGTGWRVQLDFNKDQRNIGFQDQIDDGTALTNSYRPRLCLPEAKRPTGICRTQPGYGSQHRDGLRV